MVEDDRGDSLRVGTGERATKALTEKAPMAMEMKMTLENMVNVRDDSGTRPEI